MFTLAPPCLEIEKAPSDDTQLHKFALFSSEFLEGGVFTLKLILCFAKKNAAPLFPNIVRLGVDYLDYLDLGFQKENLKLSAK